MEKLASKPRDDLSSLRSSMVGAALFAVGLLVWLGTAGLFFIIALPVMALGAFLLLFAFLTTKHSSPAAKVISGGAFLGAVGAIAFLLWAIAGFGA